MSPPQISLPSQTTSLRTDLIEESRPESLPRGSEGLREVRDPADRYRAPAPSLSALMEGRGGSSCQPEPREVEGGNTDAVGQRPCPRLTREDIALANRATNYAEACRQRAERAGERGSLGSALRWADEAEASLDRANRRLVGGREGLASQCFTVPPSLEDDFAAARERLSETTTRVRQLRADMGMIRI